MVKSQRKCAPHLSVKRRNGGRAVCQWQKWGGLKKCSSTATPTQFYRCGNCNLWLCYECNNRYVKIQFGSEDLQDDNVCTIVATSTSGAGIDAGQSSDRDISPSIISISSSPIKLESDSIKSETVPAASVKKEKKKRKKAPITRTRMAIFVDGEYYYVDSGATVKVDGVAMTFKNKRGSFAMFKKPDGTILERLCNKVVVLPSEEFAISLEIQFRNELSLEKKQTVYRKTKEILKEYGQISELDVALLPNGVGIEATFFSEASLSAFDDSTSSTFLEKVRLLSEVPHGVLRSSTPELSIKKNKFVQPARTFKCWDVNCPQKFRCLSAPTIKRHLQIGSPCYNKLKQLGISYKRTLGNIDNLLERDFDNERSQAGIISAAKILQACMKVDYRKNEIPERLLAAIKNSKRSSKLNFQFSLGRAQFVAWVLTKGDLRGYQPASDSFIMEFKTRVELSQYINEFYLTAVSVFTKTQRWIEVGEKPFKVEWNQFGADYMQGTVTVKGFLNVDI